MIKTNPQASSTLFFLVGLAGLGVAVALFYYTAEMVNAFVMALIIVITVSPVMSGLKRKGFPGWAAYLVTLLVLLAVLVVFLLLVVGAGKQFLNTMPEYLAQADDSTATVQSGFDSLGVEKLGLDSAAMSQLFNPSRPLEVTGNFIAGLLDALSSSIFIGILVVFMLVDAMVVSRKLSPYINDGNPLILRLSRYTVLVRRYIGITTIVGLVTGVLDTILFIVVGIEFALLWGILAFMFSFIPTIGFWIALIPPVILAYLQFGLPAALVVFFGIVIINGFAENIVKPRYMGIGLDLSFFTVFFSVALWSAILGSLGAILSIPLTLALKVIVLEGDEGTRWFRDLISDVKKAEELEPPA